ncbi:MAG TPA: extensin family protein [Pyrinomonadaceae bacterium]|jgi:hypothetical protein
MSRPANSFRTLGGGVPVHYDRLRREDYGTRGVPATFHATSDFEAKLDRCFMQLWESTPFGKAELLISAGAFVAKPGFHGLGRALDLDGIFWRDKTFVTLFDGFQGRDRPLYLAIEAVLRMHFGQVLNYDFNAAHHDHFHIDDIAPGFRQSSKTATFFVQNALSFVLGQPVSRDGIFGNQTRDAVARALTGLGITGSIGTPNVWQKFLEGIVKTVFQANPVPSAANLPSSFRADFVPGVGTELLSSFSSMEESAEPNLTPGELLQNVYEVIDQEIGQAAQKPNIEGAVTAFASHPEIQRVLEPDGR